MKKLYFPLFAIILSVIVFTFETNAQITFQVGGGIGYSIPTGDYGGTPSDFYNGTKYGMNPGFNLHGKARVGFIFINAFGEIGYTTFSNEGAISGNEPDKSVKYSNNVVSIKVGPEFKFNIPLSPITPYLDGFVAINTFSGKVEFKGAPDGLPSTEVDINSATRIGIGAGGGILLSLGGVNLDLSIQYSLMNIGGKQFSGIKDSRLDSYIYLNDDKDPLYSPANDKHIISNSRSIDALEFKLTALFGL